MNPSDGASGSGTTGKQPMVVATNPVEVPTATEQVLQQVMAALTTLQEDQQKLRDEMLARYSHLDGRAERNKQRVEFVHREQARAEEARATAPPLQAFPVGMKLRKLTPIDGKREQELRDWFIKAYGYIRACSLEETDPRAVYFVSQYFEGPLATWYQGIQAGALDAMTADFTSVSALRDSALKQFTGRDPAEVARDNLRTKKQTGTVIEWCNFFRRQIIHLPNRDSEDHLHAFKAGLKADIAKALATRDPQTLAEAIEMAIKIEASNKLIERRQGINRSRDGDGQPQLHNLEDDDGLSSDDDDGGVGDLDELSADEGDDSEDLNATGGGFVQRTKKDISRMMREGRCLKCGVKGHIAKKCPSKKKPTQESDPLSGDS